ncbi:MAG: four-helix bundle copper-binding protein [Firmicutes bacterium]|nr:four-helix bundle copper-binding protein [Bacillota bacterium]
MPVLETSVVKYQSCINECNRCMQVCEECLQSCLKEPDAAARAHCIALLQDCADLCALSARFMSRGSMHAKQVCGLCATICEACAAECDRFQDQHCRTCADECRRCADECRKMTSM